MGNAPVGTGRRPLTDTSSLQAAWLDNLGRAPDLDAIGFYSRRDELTWRSRRELHESAMAAGSRLVEAGLQPGQVCLIVLPSNEVAVATVLGTLLAGALPLLVAPPTLNDPNSLLPEALSRTARRTEAGLVVISESSRAIRDLVQAPALVVSEDDLASSDTTFTPHVPSRDSIAAMQLTSGTTGSPRICVWTQESVLAALEGMSRAMAVSADDICFNWTPLYHDMGLVNNLLLCLCEGMPLVMMSPQDFVRDPGLWLRGLARSEATITWSPNFGFAVTAERVKEEALAGVRLDGVRAFWNAAERIHLSTMKAFHDRFAGYGVAWEALKTNFGCAENVGGATFSDVDGPVRVEWVDRHSLYEEREARVVSESDLGAVAVVSAGTPHPGIEVEILSPRGRSLPDGQVGEIALRTPSRLLQYLGDARASQRAFHGDLLRTGDLGYQRGRDLFWVGRVKERITVRGKKVDPSDFEPILFKIEGLRPGCFVAFGVDDPSQGTQKVVVVSEVREPARRRSEEMRGEVRRLAFSELGVSVDDVVLVEQGTLTKTSSGKRRHRHFKERYEQGALTPIEERVG